MQDLEQKADVVFQRNMQLENQLQALMLENENLKALLDRCNCSRTVKEIIEIRTSTSTTEK